MVFVLVVDSVKTDTMLVVGCGQLAGAHRTLQAGLKLDRSREELILATRCDNEKKWQGEESCRVVVATAREIIRM